METKILAAVDGSPYSSNSLDYLIHLFQQNQNIYVHLFSVTTSDNEQNWMMDVDPLREYSPAVEKRIIRARKFLKEAKAKLLRNGFSDEQVTFSAATSHSDISTTIHHEANRGIYDSLLIGRRGVGMVGEMFLGSVSSYLVDKCHEVPLWIIDGEVSSSRFLLAVECMSKSLMAADHLAYIIKAVPDCEIFLYHSNALFSKKVQFDRDEVRKQWGDDWCSKNLTANADFIEIHKQILLENNIPENHITILPECIDVDASFDLLRQAKNHKCGTIVLGRRGRDIEKGFLGGVSDRTLKQANDIAIWLVG